MNCFLCNDDDSDEICSSCYEAEIQNIIEDLQKKNWDSAIERIEWVKMLGK